MLQCNLLWIYGETSHDIAFLNQYSMKHVLYF